MPPRTRRPTLDGTARWSHEAVRARYRLHCGRLKLHPRALAGPHPGRPEWLDPLLRSVIEGIKAGDGACAEIGIELLEEDGGFAFGAILKANAAWALKRCPLTPAQEERVRSRVVAMLKRGFMPHEFRDYARLLRRIGLGRHRAEVEAHHDPANPWVNWYVAYLTTDDPGRPPG